MGLRRKCVLAGMAGVLTALIAAGIHPVSVEAVKNEQVDGMVFWGTSAMSRLYGDLNREVYNEEGSRTGSSEADQHVWASYHSTDGSGYDYLNYGQFVNYTVDDAPEWASLGRVSAGQSSLIGDTSPQYWDFSNTSLSGEPGVSSIDVDGGGGGLTSITAGINEAVNTRGWDPDKTAVVIWAGEDWVVRGADSSDEGISGSTEITDSGPVFTTDSGQKILQVDWMGLDLEDNNNAYFNHSFDPAPWANEVDPVGDVLHTDTENEHPEGAHYGAGGVSVKACDDEGVYENVDNCNRLNDQDGIYGPVETGSANHAFHHMYTYGNSYRVTEEHLRQWEEDGNNPGHMNLNSGFSYSEEQDGISIQLEHKLYEETDKFPSDSDLGQQAGQTFARVLSGYDYQVEYLKHDMSQTTNKTDDPHEITIWVSTYTEPKDEQTEATEVRSWTSDSSTEASSASKTGTSTYGPQNHPADDYTYVVQTGTNSIPQYDPVTHQQTGTKHTYNYTEYSYSIIHHPARYDWTQKTIIVHTRCDEDLAPDPGYADSWHTHLYGGVGGIESGTDTEDATAEHYVNGTYEGLAGSEGDHSNDYVEVKTWYTNPDKPIMKVVTETRHVTGYIDYWKHTFSSELKVYVFGLGPYNKAIYDDQKDEYWADGDAGLDANGNVVTNNQGTAMVSTANPEWLVSASDLSAGDLATVGSIDEIKRTDRIDNARQSFNTALKSNLSGAKFVDIWDIVLDHTPYFRFQNIINSGDVTRSDAQHGKWYDQGTNNWIFHMMWSTILNDNPNPEQDDAIDISLYGTSCALTAYANEVLSPSGRSDGDTVVHTLNDVLVAGPSGAGAVLGYGDTDYGFSPYITTNQSETSSVVDYKSLIGLENGSDGSSMYLYARYGKLLSDMGIDQTAVTTSISPRMVPGMLMTVFYVANSGLSMIWEVSLDILKMFNPFQVLHDASSISTALKTGMYDDSSGILIKLAASNGTIADLLEELGAIYDALSGTNNAAISSYDPFEGGVPTKVSGFNFSIVMLYMAMFIIGFLLWYRFEDMSDRMTRVKNLVIRVLFIVLGVPFLGLCYTSFLNGLSDMIPVTAAPSSQMVASTFVDFSAWVKTSRLSPPDGSTFESVGDSSSSAGTASDATITGLRKTAWLINDSTNVLPHVDMSGFSEELSNYEVWNSSILQSYDDAKNGMTSVSEVTRLLLDWTKGSFYYSSDFGSESMADFSNYYHDLVGRRKGVGEDTSVSNPEATDPTWNNDSTLYQMFENTSTKDSWLSRDVSANTSIFTNTGEYATGDTNWSSFNIFANGALQSNVTSGVDADSTVSFTKGSVSDAPYGSLQGVSLASKTGLSTLSMYNYLLTDFGDTSMTIYSAAKAPNEHTSIGHYKVNLIGSGLTGVAFWLNCFMFLFAVAIIGFVYAFKMAISVVMQGIRMLLMIPGAMLGFLRSIAAVISTVVMMIVEVIASILMYTIVSDLMMVLATVFETSIHDGFENIMAFGGMQFVSEFAGTADGYIFGLFVSSFCILGISIGMIAFASRFHRIMERMICLSFAYVAPKELVHDYLFPEKKQKQSVGLCPVFAETGLRNA